MDVYHMARDIAELRNRERRLRESMEKAARDDLGASRELMRVGAKLVLQDVDGRDAAHGKFRLEDRPDKSLSLVIDIDEKWLDHYDDPRRNVLNVYAETWFDEASGAYVKGWRVSHRSFARVTTEQQLAAIIARIVSDYL